ncbi:4'-phosphopantetheinyl transferase superfamily protein [bacterium RCC_150]
MGETARREFLAARVAQQNFAASLLGVPASGLQAAYACPVCGSGPDIVHGQPGYLLDGGPAPLLLSASRASGWVLLAAVVRPEAGLRLGVDLESGARTEFRGFDNVALSPREKRHLDAMEPERRGFERVRLWARKEAWLKMTGEGLRLNPDLLDVLDSPRRPDPELYDIRLPASIRGRKLPQALAAAIAMGRGA